MIDVDSIIESVAVSSAQVMDHVVGDIRLIIILIAGLKPPADLYSITITVGNGIADNGSCGAAYDEMLPWLLANTLFWMSGLEHVLPYPSVTCKPTPWTDAILFPEIIALDDAYNWMPAWL